VIVALLTDFGLEDGFVAACHGVILRTAPDVRVLDVTHLVPPGDVRRGAALLAQVIGYLPPAVVVAVVDPGVGTARRAVAIEAGPHVLVGPDNGLLPWAADAATEAARTEAAPAGWTAREITNQTLMLDSVSRTFHGRDVFSPVAAHLAAGTPTAELGPQLPPDALVRLPPPVSRSRAGSAEGEILTVDRYGNLQTALTADQLVQAGLVSGAVAGVIVGRIEREAVYGETFGSVPAGRLVVYEDSAGFIAIALNGASAARLLSAAPGDIVELRARRG
jgi:S-adenosylmethionine hydrolase